VPTRGLGRPAAGIIQVVAADTECFSCVQDARADLPPRERLHIGPRWRVAHAFGTSLPGWLVVLPCRHVTALDQLTAEEAADLGPLLRTLTAAFVRGAGLQQDLCRAVRRGGGLRACSLSCHAQAAGPGPGTRGPRVFGLLGGDPASHLPAQIMDEVAISVGQALRLES
jgi:hypothetical protein